MEPFAMRPPHEWKAALRHIAHLGAEALAETLWPTRCALCDRPDTLLCDACRLRLSFIDVWQACPFCGAPFERVQCSSCFALLHDGEREPPFTQAISATLLDDTSRKLVLTYKDAGEQRLSRVIASLMAPYIPPRWRSGEVAMSYVPATKAARERRGFDHAELLARALAEIAEMPCMSPFQRPSTEDQRKLGRRERQENMKRSLALRPDFDAHRLPPKIILIDDVYTTGATLQAAARTLKEGFTAHDCASPSILCLTFART